MDFEQKKAIEQEVVTRTTNSLIKTPKVLGKFIRDIDTGRHKKWHLYRQFLSKVKGEHNTANAKSKDGQSLVPRSAPVRNTTSSVYSGDMKAKMEDRRRAGYFVRQLPFHKCRTLEEKFRLIETAECTPEIKAELISFCYRD